MTPKGWLHPDGRVRATPAGAIGEVTYRETRYNLARVIVTRGWRVTIGGETFTGETRREAVRRALGHWNTSRGAAAENGDPNR